MEIKPIKTKADYRAALKQIEAVPVHRPDVHFGQTRDVADFLLYN